MSALIHNFETYMEEQSHEWEIREFCALIIGTVSTLSAFYIFG